MRKNINNIHPDEQKSSSKIKNLGKRIFSLFKKTPETIGNEYKDQNEKTFSLLDKDMGNVAQAIKQIVADELGKDASELYPETELIKDLGGDAASIANIIEKIQDILEIPEEEKTIEENIVTVRNIIKYVETQKGLA